MQDYPHYKYRPRRKKKEGTSGSTLPGVSGSGGPGSSGPGGSKGGSKDDQVWSLAHFLFLYPFCKKSLICLAGKSMTRETLFSSVPPSNSLVSVSDPRLASCVASRTTEIQGHRQVCRARRGGPRTLSTTTDANLDCAFVKNALIYTDHRL